MKILHILPQKISDILCFLSILQVISLLFHVPSLFSSFCFFLSACLSLLLCLFGCQFGCLFGSLCLSFCPMMSTVDLRVLLKAMLYNVVFAQSRRAPDPDELTRLTTDEVDQETKKTLMKAKLRHIYDIAYFISSIYSYCVSKNQ